MSATSFALVNKKKSEKTKTKIRLKSLISGKNFLETVKKFHLGVVFHFFSKGESRSGISSIMLSQVIASATDGSELSELSRFSTATELAIIEVLGEEKSEESKS